MPRPPRFDYAGSLHHVMWRGIDRRRVFLDDADRRTFLRRAGESLSKGGALCLAWALMPNHVRLLLETGPRALSRVMQSLGSAYARDFNDRHGRAGHVFQGRFKSKVVEDGTYVTELVRYIHLNPVKAGIVPDLERLADYPWTGHRTLLGRGRESFQDTGRVLRLLGKTTEEAREVLLNLMRREIAPTRPAPVNLEVGVVGSDGFRARLLAGEGDRRQRAMALEAGGWTTGRVKDWVCGRLGVQGADVAVGRRTAKVSEARAAIVFLALETLRRPQAEVARAVGVSPQAVSRALDRGRFVVETRALVPRELVD